MDRSTGAPLDGDAHLAQSIGDILTTPVGTRVMLRDYGSMLFELIDRPINAATRLLMLAASADAIARWEPRIRLTRVNFSTTGADGRVALDIEGYRTDRPAGANSFTRLAIPLTA
ncbi:GPW/gp25 family protein [Sphingopyxis sp. MC1]|uniref:GPW/gp25 family protein n=2 Tax=unclassified Sphingopyxis TaxID=2614943 RepID=UPI001E2B15D5|nr:GPW/gp25 family protein [Sphingopyxis sp. MC1]